MSNKPKTSDPRIFLVAANDEKKDCEREYDLTWHTHIITSHSRHVLGLRIEVFDDHFPASSRPVLSYEGNWPNSTQSTFEAYLYQCYHKVARMCENWYDDQHRNAQEGRQTR